MDFFKPNFLRETYKNIDVSFYQILKKNEIGASILIKKEMDQEIEIGVDEGRRIFKYRII